MTFFMLRKLITMPYSAAAAETAVRALQYFSFAGVSPADGKILPAG